MAIKKSRTEKWIKIKTGGKWEKVTAPAFEENLKIFLRVAKRILELLEFKIEGIESEIVPKKLYDLGMIEESFSLPTKTLIGHSSPKYPERNLRYRYWGGGYFLIITNLGDEVGKGLVHDSSQLYKRSLTKYLETRDISVIEKEFRAYYGIPEKVEVREPEKMKLEKEKAIEVQIEIEKPEIPEKLVVPVKKEKVKVPPKTKEEKEIEEITPELILPPRDEVIKIVNEFQPKDPFDNMAYIRFEMVKSLLRDEGLKNELYNAFYPITKDYQRVHRTDFFKKASEIQQAQENLLQEKRNKENPS